MMCTWRFFWLVIALGLVGHLKANTSTRDLLLVEDIPTRGIVFDIIQDSRGFIWLGTEYGLARYDGHELEYFEHDPANPHSLASNVVEHLVEAPDGTLWIGTRDKGVHKFNPRTRRFKRFQHIPGDTSTIAHNRISALCLDHSGNLWVGTIGGGLDRINLLTEKIFHYHHNEDEIGAYGTSIIDIQCTERGQLWVAGYKSLDKYDVQEDKFYHFQEIYLQDTTGNVISSLESISGSMLVGTRSGQLFSFDTENEVFNQWNLPDTLETFFSGKSVWAIHRDHEGQVWVGRGNSLILLPSSSVQDSTANKVWKVIHHSPNYRVFSIYQSLDGIIWIGSYEEVYKISLEPKKLKHYLIEIQHDNMIVQPGVTSVAPFDQDHVWIGSTQGLFLFNRKNNTISQELLYSSHLDQLLDMNIVALYRDSGHGLWISSVVDFNQGFALHYLDLNRMQVRDFTRRCKLFYYDVTQSITEDDEGNLWFANGSGLIHYEVERDSFSMYQVDPSLPNSLPDNSVQKVFLDSQNRLWIGFNQGGLVKYDPVNQYFIKVYKQNKGSKAEAFGQIRDIAEDKWGNIWVGTSAGLHRFHPDSMFTTSYSKKQGLPDNTLSSILTDERGNIWLGTHNGFSKFNPATQSFNNFTYKEGIQHTEYWDRSCMLAPDGYMYFGGNQGINYFHPDSLLETSDFPKVVISGFSLFNAEVHPGDPSSLLREDISFTSALSLKYNQNVFSFSYTALDFQFPDKIRFAYQMLGFDEEWQYVGSKREVTYTNLDPGEYTFFVKASNEHGDWNEEAASLNIFVIGPWWTSWWAYVLYGLAAVGFIVGLRHFEIQQIKLSQKSAHLMELDTLKARFFANISHEFRTPLTLIHGPAHHILTESADNQVKKNAKIILRNSDRLLKLVNQLLDISKLDAGKMSLHAQKTDLVSLFKYIASSYDSLIADKDISYDFISETPQIMVYVDEDKIGKVFHNLLSNALKFIPQGGKVSVHVKTLDNKWVLISVHDSGPGIPYGQLHKVFDRFYQVDNTTSRAHEGSGLGMALAKELVELHQGKITVESKEGLGTTFMVKLLLGKAHLSSDEILEIGNTNKNKPQETAQFVPADFTETRQTDHEIENLQDVPILLIVEDNADMRHYIAKVLKSHYRIREATNGKEGLNKAREILPDLIISDVMMPVMDGLSMCELIKSQELTAHIPVILLTAKADRESKLSGLQLGADDYLCKPFDAEEILLIVRNRIEEKRKMHEYLSRNGIYFAPQSMITSLDEKFLNNVLSVIETNLDNEKLSIELLSQKVGISRVQLYRKIKALTNRSPNHLLRLIRLKRAAEKLRAKSDNISQIAFSVGFNSLSYFNKCFKEEFGMTPTEFEAKN